MKLRNSILAGAAALMATAPIAAQAADSLPTPRTASPMAESEQLRGAMLFVVLGIAALVVLLLVIDDDDEEPESP